MRHALLVTSVLIGLAACSNDTPPADTAPAPATPASTPAATAHAFSPEVTAADYAEFTRVLASDELEGRGPGSPGETKTIEYLIQQYQRMGFEPGNNGSWIQTVPMVTTATQPGASLTLTVDGQAHALEFGSQMVLGTRNGAAETAIKDSEVVFVGYGVNAPELGWNDYAGLDVKGKTVVMFINDPGFHTGDESLFEGRRMTYYGRWTYKYEEAARQGAAAALIIHDDAGAAYPWAVVQNGWSGPQFDLPASEDPDPRLPMQGWLTAESAQYLIASTGKDLDTLRREASTPGFKPMALKASVSANFKSTVREGKSDNVVALLPGSARADEAVIYMAHWDHLGRTFQATGDGIFNGAIDNATGVAGILELAEKFASGPRPQRSLLFLTVTMEESGLLGSKYYVAHPTIPLNKTVGVINLDAMTVIGRTRDFEVVGKGSSEMEDLLTPLLAAQGRTAFAEVEVQNGYYFRSDHFNFAKAGVPALYAKGGLDHVEKGAEYGKAQAERYTTQDYHKPSDEFDPAWDLSGVIEDLAVLYGVGETLANSEQWPNWYASSAFRSKRDAMMAAPATP